MRRWLVLLPVELLVMLANLVEDPLLLRPEEMTVVDHPDNAKPLE